MQRSERQPRSLTHVSPGYEMARRPEMMTAPTAQFQATSTATSPSLLKTRRAWQGLRPVKVWRMHMPRWLKFTRSA